METGEGLLELLNLLLGGWLGRVAPTAVGWEEGTGGTLLESESAFS